MELEFSVDPLFKKVAADFDEGGAKGLLLNHLAIDASGRIVFDSSDDVEDAMTEKHDAETDDPVGTNNESSIDINALGAKFFPDLNILDQQDICPSLKDFDLGDSAGSLDIPFLKIPEDQNQKLHLRKAVLGIKPESFLMVTTWQDLMTTLGSWEVLSSVEMLPLARVVKFGPRRPLLSHMCRISHSMRDDAADGEGDGVGVVGVGDFNPGDNQYTVSMHHKMKEGDHEDILSYFDNALQKNWAGPEHWRIRRIKDLNKPSAPGPSKRKEKEPFEIDFHAPLDPALAELIYTPAVSHASITLPKALWKSQSRNLLPDDKHFNSRQLLKLFLKPNARIGRRRLGSGGRNQTKMEQVGIPEGEIDEAFWARKENDVNQAGTDDDAPQGDYDADFFQDDEPGYLGGQPEDQEVFADARELLSPEGNPPGADSQRTDGSLVAGNGSQEGAFGTQLVTQSRRLRPEYVQYARVAKKVDVRRLKEEMWRGTGFKDVCFFNCITCSVH